MLQMIDTYLPGAVAKGKVTTIDFTPVQHSDGCHADLVIYLPVTTYFCTDLYFVVRHSRLRCQCVQQPFESWVIASQYLVLPKTVVCVCPTQLF